MTDAVETIKHPRRSALPIFGICLGHQLLGLRPRRENLQAEIRPPRAPTIRSRILETGKIEITSQNHGFCVDLKTLPSSVKTTHVNLNDGTSEGMAHTELPAFSVQYHPEASAGPHDSRYLFERFRILMLDPPGGRSNDDLLLILVACVSRLSGTSGASTSSARPRCSGRPTSGSRPRVRGEPAASQRELERRRVAFEVPRGHRHRDGVAQRRDAAARRMRPEGACGPARRRGRTRCG